jgi:hypothetical protein
MNSKVKQTITIVLQENLIYGDEVERKGGLYFLYDDYEQKMNETI